MTDEEYTEIMDKSNFMIDSANPYDMEILEAIVKQLPKKPKNRLTSGQLKYKVHDCPNCGEHFGFRTNVNYCEVCGQKLDWNEIKGSEKE